MNFGTMQIDTRVPRRGWAVIRERDGKCVSVSNNEAAAQRSRAFFGAGYVVRRLR